MIGGPHVTAMDEAPFSESSNVDIVVRSEGEQTMLELAHLVSEGELKKIIKFWASHLRKTGKSFEIPIVPSCKTLIHFLFHRTNTLM